MSYTIDELKEKLFEMYPEIKKHDISIGVQMSQVIKNFEIIEKE